MSSLTTTADNALFTALKEKLNTSMKAAIIEMIPEEKYNELIEACFDEFMNGPRAYRFKNDTVYMDKDDARNPTGKAGYVTVVTELITPMKNNEKYFVNDDPNTLPGMLMKLLREEALLLSKSAIAKWQEEHRSSSNDGTDQAGPYRFSQVMLNDAIVNFCNANAGRIFATMLSGVVNQAMNAHMAIVHAPNGYRGY